MSGIVESVMIAIRASVSGAGDIAGLTGGIGALSGKLLGLNSGLQIVQQVAQGVNQMVSEMDRYAQMADGAAVSARSWQVVLERFNVDAKSAGEAISDLSQRTGASEMSLKSAAAQYIKMGGTLEDFSKVALAASSSWYDLTVKSISLDDAIQNVSRGVASGRSELLESSDIMLNASVAWARYAKEVGKSVDELSDAEKAHAYAVGVYKEEQIGIETLAEKQTELSRAKNLDTQATQRLGEAIGRNLLPYQVKLTETSTEVKRTLTQMFDAYQQGGDALKVLTDKYPQLGKALTQLKPLAEDMRRALLDAWGGISDYANRVLLPAFEGIRPVVERVWKYIPPLIESAGRLIGETFRTVADLWVNVLKPVWDAIGPVVEYGITKSIEALQDGFDFISGTFAAIRGLIAGDWRGAWDTFSETIRNAAEKVDERLEGLRVSIRTALTKLATDAWERGKTFGQNLQDGIIAGISGLAEQLTDRMTDVITKMTANLPQWFKDRFGITAVVETLEGNADAAGARATAAQGRITDRAPEIDPKTLNEFQKFILKASEEGRGLDGKFTDKADNLIDWCARWMRDTLGDAAPEMRMAINALFLNNPEKGGPTARSAYGNFQKAGLARDYKTFADLKVGDSVFYTDLGQNHIGVYIGNGQVRGNNRVTYQDNGGRFGPGGINSGKALDNGRVNPVGDVDIDRLGKVTGYVRSDELKTYLDGRVPVTGQPKAGTTANTQTTGATQPPPPDTADKGSAFTSEQYAQALRLVAVIEKANKAFQADTGNFTLAKALSDAQKESEKFAKSSDAATEALKQANAATGKAKSSTDAYIVSQADFAKYGKEALLLVKEQQRVTDSGTALEREATRGKVEAFTKDSKVRAAVLQAESAAYQSRKQLSDKAAQAEQARAQLVADIARDAAAGREVDARAGLESLKRQQQSKLDAVGGAAARTAQVIARTGPQILAAEALVNREVRKQAVAAAQELADKRLEVAGANATQIEAERKATAVRAYQAEARANAIALADQQRAERNANKTAVEAQKAREKEQRALRAQYAAERRDLDVSEAQATLKRTQELNQQELADFKGTVAQRVALLKRQAQDEYDATEQAARAARDKAVREFQNKGGPNQQANIDGANTAYTDTIAAAARRQAADGKAALEAQTKATQGAREGYSKLAEAMRAKIATGKVETADLVAYLQGMKDVQDANDKLGLSQNKYVKAAQQSAEATYQAGIDAQIASGAFNNLAEGHSLAGAASGKYLGSVEDVLAQMPATVEGSAAYLKVLTDLAAQGYISAEAIDAVTEAVAIQTRILQSATEESGRRIQLIRDSFTESEEAGGSYADTLSSLGGILKEAIGQGLNPRDSGFVGLLDEYIAKGGQAADAAQHLKDNLDDLLADSGAQDPATIQYRGKRAMDRAIAANNAETPEGTTLEQSQANSAGATLLSNVFSGSATAQLRSAIAASLADTFSDIGAEGREAFWARFGELSGSQEFGAALDALSGPELYRFITAIGDAPEWADLKSKLEERFAGLIEPLTINPDNLNLEGVIGAITARIDEAQASYESGASDAGAYNATLIEQEAALLKVLVGLDRLGPAGAAAAASVRLLLNATTASIDPMQRLAVELTTLGDEKAADLAIQGVTLVKSFQEGATSAKDFAQQGLDLAGSMNTMADAAERAGRADLASEYRAWAKELDDLAPAEKRSAYYAGLLAEATAEVDQAMGGSKPGHAAMIARLEQLKTAYPGLASQIGQLVTQLGELDKKTARTQGMDKAISKINEFADYARKLLPVVTSALKAFGASDEIADAWGDSLGRMVDDVASFAGDVVRILANPADIGAWVGAVTKGLGAIFNYAGRRNAELAAEAKRTADYSNQFKFDQGDGYGTRKVTATETGFLFWKKTVYTEEVDQAAKSLALSFENAVTGGVGSGLAAAVASGDSSILEKSILTSMKTAVLEGLTQAFLGSASVVAVMGPLIGKLVAAFKTGNTENIRAAVAEFRDGMKGLRAEMDGLVEAAKIATEEMGETGESFASSFSESIRSGVRALLSGQSPLQALYDDVRGKIENAVVNGFFVQAALDKLQPFMDALRAKLDAGLDPSQAVAQIGMQLPGISAQLQIELGPLVAALNTYLPNALNGTTAALKETTAALRETQFNSTTILSYADVGRPSDVRQQLAGL